MKVSAFILKVVFWNNWRKKTWRGLANTGSSGKWPLKIEVQIGR